MSFRFPRITIALIGAGALCASPGFSAEGKPEAKPQHTVFDFSLATMDGKNAPLGTYKGKVVLLCTIADQSQYSAQLSKLDGLYTKYKEAGLVVLGVPTNEFGVALVSKDSPQQAYTEKRKLAFPIFGPAETRGKTPWPLFEYLSQQKGVDGKVHWVFEKFLFDKTGKLIARFESDTEPDSPELLAAVAKALAGEELEPKKDDKPEAPSEEEEGR